MFNKIHDVFDVCMGKDLKEVAEERESKKTEDSKVLKGGNKSAESEKNSKSIGSKTEITPEKVIDLLEYADSEDFLKDLKEVFKKKKASKDFEEFLTVLNSIFDVPLKDSKKDDYKLEFNFIDSATKERRNKQGEALLSSGVQIDQLKDYNLALEVSRVNKETGEKLQDGTEEDRKKIENLLREQFSKDVSKR